MIGKLEELFCYGVNLEKRVPLNHPLRKIKQALDLRFVRTEVSQFYGYNGNESVDPEVIVKLMLLLFLDDIASERELMRMVPYTIAGPSWTPCSRGTICCPEGPGAGRQALHHERGSLHALLRVQLQRHGAA